MEKRPDKPSDRKRFTDSASKNPSPALGAPFPGSSQVHAPVPELPVFTFPNSLCFYAEEKDSLRQILTIYNPYEFPLKFRVYCTAPKLYSVVDAQGTVKPGFCSDIIVRHNSPIPSHFGKPEKFRIQIYDSLAAGNESVGKLLGKKTLEAVLYEKRPLSGGGGGDDENDGEFSQLLSAPSASTASSASRDRRQLPVQWQPGQRLPFSGIPVGSPGGGGQFSTPSPVILFVAILCITALCLPTENVAINSQVPLYLHLSFNQKLVAAYILVLTQMEIWPPERKRGHGIERNYLSS